MPKFSQAIQEESRKKLERAGIRVTSQRQWVVASLMVFDDHPTIEELHRRIQDHLGNIGIASLYRAVALLEEKKVVVARQFDERFKRYELLDGKASHHHILDIETGEITEFQSEALVKLLSTIAKENGYEDEKHSVCIHGKRGVSGA